VDTATGNAASKLKSAMRIKLSSSFLQPFAPTRNSPGGTPHLTHSLITGHAAMMVAIIVTAAIELAKKRRWRCACGATLEQNQLRASIVPARDKLPKGLSRPVQREAAGQIKQIIVSRHTVADSSSLRAYRKKVANPIPRVPRQVPDRVSIFRGRLFPQSRPHLVCGANGTALSVLMAWQIPR
jgi:hypothetical protein